jgi:hypothetical protein
MSNESFQSLDGKKKQTQPVSDAPLAKWYESVRSQPIAELSHADLARALRQSVHLDVTLPHALERLQRDPLAGAPFAGELLRAVLDVAPEVWAERAGERKMASALVDAVLASSERPKAIWSDAEWNELRSALLLTKRTLANLTWLVVDAGPQPLVGRRFLLPFTKSFAVGSGPECELMAPEAALEKVHARFRITDAGFEVAGMRGPIGVDGESKESATVKDKTKLVFGKLTLRVEVLP